MIKLLLSGVFITFMLGTTSVFAKPKPAFQVKEQLHYTLHWTVFLAGYTYLRIPRTIRYKNRECLVIESGARSTGFLGTIFPVKDKIISYWDPLAKRTLFSQKDLKQGNYFRHSQVKFNPKNNTAEWILKVFSGNTDKLGEKKENVKWKVKQGVQKDLPSDVQDILSANFYNRSVFQDEDVEVGKSYYVNIFDDNKFGRMKMTVLRKEILDMKINGKQIKIPSFVVKPKITTHGVFPSKGDMNIWVSDDHRHWPLQIKAEAPVVGHFHIKLYRTVNTTP